MNRIKPAATIVKRRTNRKVMDKVRGVPKGAGQEGDLVGSEDIADAAEGLDHFLLEGVVHFCP